MALIFFLILHFSCTDLKTKIVLNKYSDLGWPFVRFRTGPLRRYIRNKADSSTLKYS